MVAFALEIQNTSITFHTSNASTRNFNIFVETFAHAMRSVFDVSPTNLEDNDDIMYFLFPIDFRWASFLTSSSLCNVSRCLAAVLVSHFLFPHEKRPKSVRGIGNKSNVDRQRPDLDYFSDPRRHLIWKEHAARLLYY